MQRHLDGDLPLPINLDEPWLGAGFRDENVSIGQRLHSVDLRLRTLKLENDFTIASDFHGSAAGIGRIL